MKIGIIKGASTNNVLRTFADRLAAGVEVNGHESTVFDITQENILAGLITTLRRERYDAVVSFNAMTGELMGPEQRGLLELAGIPYIGWLVDHPCYHYHRLTTPNEYRWTLCPSTDHIDFLEGAGVGGLWQHMLGAADPQPEATCDFARRSIPVMFAATWMREPDKFWEHITSETTRAIVEDVIERAMDDGDVSVTRAFADAMAAYGQPLRIDAGIARITAAILYFIRKHDRLKLVGELAKSGLPVTLYGKGWKENLAHHGNLEFVDDVPADELNRRYAAAKFVLNINAANGASERAFAAMQAGACVLSDQNELLAAAAEPGKEIVFFDRRRPDVLAQALGDLLESGQGEDIAARGMRNAQARHTWTHRSAQLLQWIAESAEETPLTLETA